MAIRIKQGDQYSVPILIRLNGETVDIDELAEVEFTFGDGTRKLWPQDVQYNSADNCFYLPLTQEETFALPPGAALPLDVRVKFAGGEVLGSARMGAVAVCDAISGEVL